MESLSYSDGCFACEMNNDCGIKLEFKVDGEEAAADFVLGERFQGWNGIAHGGIVATVLDEAMAWALGLSEIKAVTAEMNIRYKKPAPIGKKLRVVGRLLENKGRVLMTESSMYDGQTLLATATARYVRIG